MIACSASDLAILCIEGLGIRFSESISKHIFFSLLNSYILTLNRYLSGQRLVRKLMEMLQKIFIKIGLLQGLTEYIVTKLLTHLGPA